LHCSNGLRWVRGLAAIRDRMPDILISDLNMPRMTGFELLSIVRRRFPTIAVIAMSGAYFGATVPAGVAADGFYAKGSSSIDRLFEILRTIGDEVLRHSARAATPIWIPGVPIDERDLSTVVVACPECLRTFSYCLHILQLSYAERRCPHCLHTMRLSVVRQETVSITPVSRSMPSEIESVSRRIFASYIALQFGASLDD
jgi:CheY-like chemotaxis protein